MLYERMVADIAAYVPRLRFGHKGQDRFITCPRGCDAEFSRRLETDKDFEKANRAYRGRHFLSLDKRLDMAVHFVDTGHWPEAHRKEVVSEEEHLSRENRGFKEQSVIQAFKPGDMVEIAIPFLAQKHGAMKEKENQSLHGSLRKVLPTPPHVSHYERLVTVGAGGEKTVGVPATWCRLIKVVA